MTINLKRLEKYAYGPMQFSSQSVDDMRVGDMLDFVRDIPTISNDISAISRELLDARSEIERLKASLKEAGKLLGSLSRVCDIAHHAKHERHTLQEGCPVEKRIDNLLEKIKVIM